MFERFTERARKVVVLAQDEARHFNHDYIGTEHLLLGLLLEDEGIPARVHSTLDVHPDKVRRQVLLIFGEEPESNSLRAAQVAMEQWVAGNEVLFRGAGRWAFQTLLVDLKYAYAVRDINETLQIMDHKAALDRVLGIFEANSKATSSRL
jgi:ATP-dependent Clp protease ATP-binding subunit ClpA